MSVLNEFLCDCWLKVAEKNAKKSVATTNRARSTIEHRITSVAERFSFPIEMNFTHVHSSDVRSSPWSPLVAPPLPDVSNVPCVSGRKTKFFHESNADAY